ncbi:glycosyltransferase [Actinosynnema sp. NPDC023794]
MKVLVATPWYPTPQHPIDGVFVREQVRGLAEHHDVAVLHIAPPVTGPAPPTRVDGIPVFTASWRARTGPIGRVRAVLDAVRRIRRSGFEPDLVHAQIAAKSVPALVAAKRLSVPLVVTEQWSRVMDLDPRPLPPGQRRSAAAVYQGADAVLAVGSELRRAIKDLTPRARVLVVPNPVDTTVFHPGLRPTATEDGRLRLITTGRLVDYKGVDQVLQATALLRDRGLNPHLDVIGEGPELGRLRAMAADLRLADAVRFHGRQHKADFAPLVAAAHVAVVAGDFETFCVAGIEALACGTPVVATRCGGPQDYITPRNGRLVPLWEPGLMANAIAGLVDRADVGSPEEIARATAAEYGIDAVGRRIAGIYQRLHRR